jgi:MFS family permease
MAGVRAVIAGSAALLLFAGFFNVAELPFVTDELGGGDAGFALLNGLHGVGFIGGSLAGAKGGDPAYRKRWWLIGLAVVSGGLLASGAAPSMIVAALAFSLAGLGNGLLLVYERLLIQALVPDRLMGRVFGVKDGLTAWTFAAAFLAAGGLVEAIGPRAVMVAAGAGGVVVWVTARIALRGSLEGANLGEAAAQPLAGRSGSLRRGAAGEDGADSVGGGDGGSPLLDHTH